MIDIRAGDLVLTWDGHERKNILGEVIDSSHVFSRIRWFDETDDFKIYRYLNEDAYGFKRQLEHYQLNRKLYGK